MVDRSNPTGKITVEVDAELKKAFRTKTIQNDTTMQEVLEDYIASYVEAKA